MNRDFHNTVDPDAIKVHGKTVLREDNGRVAFVNSRKDL